MAYIKLDEKKFKDWRRSARMFQDDIVCAIGTDFMEKIAEAENKMIFDILSGLESEATADVVEVKQGADRMAELKFEQYLILYDDDSYFHTDNAVSVKDCLIQFLDYTGNNVPLIRKAFNGMETEKDMVDLINAITNKKIDYIYKIDKQIYGTPQKEG